MNNQKIPSIYQKIVEEISFDSLPAEWLRINLSSFSNKISLFDYQQEAVKNAIKLLYYYFNSLQKFRKGESEKENIERKKKFFNEIRFFEKETLDNLGITNKKNKIFFNKLKQYYPVIQENSHEKIHFLHFINRMSFWMATGSGKTIVLIKLIELLDKLKRAELIPDNDILILTYREDLVEQIKKHIMEFNKSSAIKIKVWDLKNYDDVKRGNLLAFKENINIFIYRSDLISDKTKEKLLGFEDIENDGKWYVLLDEAHKGEKEDSKKQAYYSLLTRNGFLFNFSATFTDTWDIITTVYNFNLDAFIREGYGKNVYLSQQELNAFKREKDFESKNKQKIVLKSLIFLVLSKKAKENISKKLQNNYYHNPLLLALVNSVNTKDSDLEVFFREIEKIAIGEIDKTLFKEAKDEIIREITEHPRYILGSESLSISEEFIKNINLKDILEKVFNSNNFGKVEVMKLPNNKEELIFKLKTSDKPFALVKIGDITSWLKNKLENYEINESYNNKSFFKNINEENDHINILMGSRAFYEGWDSDRPNVMIFINIGKENGKKYVTQSIGRGVRIQPVKGKRKRIFSLRKEGDIVAKEIASKVEKENISLIETLFVFGTNKKNVQEILDSIKYDTKISGKIIELEKNKESKNKILIIPVYKNKVKELNVEELPKFEGNKDLLNSFLNWIDDDKLLYNILSSEENINPKNILKIKKFIEKGKFNLTEYRDVYFQLMKLNHHVNITLKEIERFKHLEEEIIHFKKIKVSLKEEEINELKEKIEKVKIYEDPIKKEEKLKRLLESKQMSLDEFTSKIKELSKMSNEEIFKTKNSTLKIKHIVNHYYVPIIISDKEKVSYINHIIKIESEKRFIEKLEQITEENKELFKVFDWWMFSKVDEHLDNVFIPYYNRSNNRVEKFKPDFIFWFKKGEKYFIVFVDPKGTKHTDYEYKVDGYKSIFEENNNTKTFRVEDFDVKVYLFLFTKDKNLLSEGYKKYWADEFKDIVKKIKDE